MNFVMIYNFVIKASSVVVFDINILGNIILMGKIPKKYHKSQKLTKLTLNLYWMRFDVLHDCATLEYQYPSDCFTRHLPDGNSMYISIKFGTGVHVFCWKIGIFNRSCFCSVSCKWLMVILQQGKSCWICTISQISKKLSFFIVLSWTINPRCQE